MSALFHQEAPGHRAGVATQAAPVGTTTLAYCSCGWQRSFRTRSEALCAAEDHTEENA